MMSDGSDRYPDDWGKLRKRILSRDRWQCTECGAQNTKLHVHHITPISDGGGHEVENLKTVCADCHADIHDEAPCEICGLFADIELLEMKSSGSGGPFHMCSNCFASLNAGSDCGICGGEASGKYYLLELAEDGFTCNICNECRKMTVFSHQYGHVDKRLRAKKIERFLN